MSCWFDPAGPTNSCERLSLLFCQHRSTFLPRGICSKGAPLTRHPMNAIKEAERAGFDLTLVDESLRRSSEQQAVQDQEALTLALALEQAGKQLRDRPQSPAAAPLRR